jgi:hypothetical protein
MNKNSSRNPQVINCNVCDKKYHYKYTREDLVELYHPKQSLIKPCISDYCMGVVWLNYKIEYEETSK